MFRISKGNSKFLASEVIEIGVLVSLDFSKLISRKIFLPFFSDSASPGDDDTPSIPAPKAVQNNVNNQSANSEPPVSDQTSIESISSKVEEVKLEEPEEPSETSEVKNEVVDAKENVEPKEIDANSVPLPTSASDEEEFHEASESVSLKIRKNFVKSTLL